MKKHLRTLMAGALVIVPIAVTVWLISWIGTALAAWGENFLRWIGLLDKLTSTRFDYGGVVFNYAGAVGVIIALIIVYFIGMLANVWLFRKLFNFVDSTLSSLPGIKTIYESVRDLMKLFGGSDGGKIGYAALYTPPRHEHQNARNCDERTPQRPAQWRPPGNYLSSAGVYDRWAYCLCASRRYPAD